LSSALFRHALILGAALAFAFGSAVAQERLVIASTGEADNLDPRVATDVRSFERISAIFEPLVVFDRGLGLQPRLATSWSFNDDATQITFDLRDDVTFHHGRAFTAEDVIYTFEWVLDPENPSLNRPLYTDIASIEAPDAHTVVFTLSRPNAFLLNNIARMPIVPADRGEEPDFQVNPSGTGAFSFVSWQRDDALVLAAFEDYWGQRARVDEVVFRSTPEDGTRLLALEAGDVDLYQGGPIGAELPRLEADPNIGVDRVPAPSYNFVGFNTRAEPLGDVRVRQAIAHLIPREGIVERILEGVGQVGISMLLPEMPWFESEIARYPYDPERARELLAEAGYPDGGFSVRIYSDPAPARTQIAEILLNELLQVGIDATVQSEESSAVFQRFSQTEDYEIMVYAWNGQLDPDRAIFRQFTSGGSAYAYTYWSDPRVDELALRGQAVAPDSDESVEIYREIQRIVGDEVPYTFVNYIEEVAVYRAGITGWSAHPHSSVTYQDLNLVGWD
jgi:peptide/nickel transport system substrate-binding protein